MNFLTPLHHCFYVMSKLFRTFIMLFLADLIFSCAGPDKLCDCIQASDTLTKKSQALLSKKLKYEDIKDFRILQRKKNIKCKTFANMGGKEMMEKKASCNLDSK
jgi:hypothetical protein